MPRLLQITSSLFANDGVSTILASRFAQTWRQAHPDGEVVVRDFASDPVPHLDASTFQAFGTDPAERTAEQRAAVAYSDTLIAELRDADAIVIGLPMYNFGVPSQLKAWFDHIARAGVTFRYGENGPEGLLADKPVTVLATRGGRYQGTPRDTQTPYVRDFLAFIGLTRVEFIYAEGLAQGAVREAALDRAAGRIEKLAA